MQFIAISCLCYNLMQFCAYVAIQCNFAIITAIFLQKKRFWANISTRIAQIDNVSILHPTFLVKNELKMY